MPARKQLITSLRSAQRWLRRLIPVILLPGFALLLLVAMWGAVLYQLQGEREAALKDAVAHSQSLAHTLAEYTGQILRQADHATQLYKLRHEASPATVRLSEFAARGGLAASVLPTRLALPMAVVDRHGKVVDSVNGFVPAWVRGAPFLEVHAASRSDTPQFNTPVVAPASGKWQIQVSRRLNDAAGGFAGAIVILIDPAYFVDDYDRLELEDEGALLLMSRNTGLSVGRVGERMIISDKLDFLPVRKRGHPPGELAASFAPDQVARVYSAREMPRFSLVAIVGMTERAAMARFERHRLAYTGAAALATALILAVIAVLMQQSARLRASMRAAREAQATLRAASSASLDAVILLKAWRPRKRTIEDFIVVDINERGANMVGLSRADLVGKKACATLPICRSAGFFERYVKVLESGEPLEEEFEFREQGYEPRWLHHQIVPIDDGVAITSRDITARKQADLEIRNNRSFLQSLIDHLPLLIYVKSLRPDDFGTMLVWNESAEAATGYSARQVVGRTAGSAFPPDSGLHDPDQELAMLASPAVLDVPEKPFLCANGSLRYLHSVAVPLFDRDGKIEYMLGIGEDITARREQEQTLRKNQAELAAVNDASPLGLVRSDQDGQCTYVNRTFEAITGLARKDALGEGWIKAVHPDDRGIMRGAYKQLSTTGKPFQGTLRCRHRDGKIVWTSVKIAPILVDGKAVGYVGSIDDITTLREAEIALRESEARLRTIADSLPAMVAYVDADQGYRFYNIAYEREFGRDRLRVIGRSVRETVGDARYKVLAPYIERVLKGETLMFEEEDVRDGVERTLEVNYIPQTGSDGKTVVGFHVMRQDITSKKRERKHLLKLAQVDALTGLTNRAGFMHRLTEAMFLAASHDSLMAVMYLDIDRFKPVNDTHGHSIGDQLLKVFSGRLTHTLRASDTVARLGGDEFTIIMEKLHRHEDASAVAAKIVGAMQAPFHLDGVVVSVSASIGLAFYRGGEMTPEALLKQADVQLYQAKQAGRNTYRDGTEPRRAKAGGR